MEATEERPNPRTLARSLEMVTGTLLVAGVIYWVCGIQENLPFSADGLERGLDYGRLGSSGPVHFG